MTPADKIFKQSEFINNSESLQKTNPGGVCKVLVAEWLAAGGALGGSSFSRRGRGTSASTRIANAMNIDRADTLAEYGLFKVGEFGPTSADKIDELTTFLEQQGYFYYVKYFGGEGHAIGVVNRDGKIRVFDPNKGEWSCGSVSDMRVKMVQLLIYYAEGFGFDGIECWRLQPPSFLGLK